MKIHSSFKVALYGFGFFLGSILFATSVLAAPVQNDYEYYNGYTTANPATLTVDSGTCTDGYVLIFYTADNSHQANSAGFNGNAASLLQTSTNGSFTTKVFGIATNNGGSHDVSVVPDAAGGWISAAAICGTSGVDSSNHHESTAVSSNLVSLTTTATNDIIYESSLGDGGISGSSYTVLANWGGTAMQDVRRDVSSVGTYSIGSTGGSGVWTGVAVALLDSGGGGGGSGTTTATSTLPSSIDNPNLDLFLGIIVFFLSFGFIIWAI